MEPKLPLRCSVKSVRHDVQESEEERLSKKWLSKAVALCKDIFPSAKHDTLSVEYLSNGSYNAVFAISVVIAGDQPVEHILRIPAEEFPVPRTAAILDYLAQSTSLRVPKVIAWDTTPYNALGSSYVVLSHIPGKPLYLVWGVLAQDQKLQLARELIHQLIEIESLTNPSAGVIKAHETGFRHGDEVSDKLFVETLGSDVLEYLQDSID
ncbi:hypothetical protein GGR52DRAFT_163183 [Hypoxylon sp. FL1284]|nr:hypothetical protein GGR52DRAFT_163183 [Hypoxylon sp. FL1284]